MWIAVAAVLITVVLGLVLLNLSGSHETLLGEIEHDYSVSDPHFSRVIGTLLGPPILEGNRVDTLLNGAEIFPAMLEAIRSAERTITFETYIYWTGEIGREFADALSERSRSGIRVHVLMDWVGAGKAEDALIERMKAAGVGVEMYRPLRWHNLTRLNHRTHRKLLVVDGRIGFTGGVGIADLWLGRAEDPEHWRDTHFRLQGPAVAQMQSAFLDNWLELGAEVLDGEGYFPALSPLGRARAQVFKSSFGEGTENTRLMYLLAIAAAERSILIANAYFVPDHTAIDSLIAARKRGVRIEIIVPGHHIDSDMVRQASRAVWGELLEAGIEIWEFQPTMYHVKCMVVDGFFTSVGSTNFDSRSFSLNDEANLNVLDREFAALQERIFEDDKARSRRVSLEVWRRRPWTEKVSERLAGLFRSQL